MVATSINDETVRSSTRDAILDLLKSSGPLETTAIAGELGITAVAVRQHLFALAGAGLIAYTMDPRPVGRPVKLWTLTASGDRQFGDTHADLAVSLLTSMKEAFGADSMAHLLNVRKRHILAAYKAKVPKGQSLKKRLEALAAIRAGEGYMASVGQDTDGTLMLLENHCPICAAAAACQGLCAIEKQVFEQTLGPGIEFIRTEHIQAGARRCAYRVVQSG